MGAKIKHRSSPAVPAWKRRLIRRLYRLVRVCSKISLDGDLAVPISPCSARTASKVIRGLPDGIQVPRLVPGPDGDIALEWHGIEGSSISVICICPTLAYVGNWADASQPYKEECFCGVVPERILKILIEHFPGSRPPSHSCQETLVGRNPKDIKLEFNELASRWKAERSATSSSTCMAIHWAYQRIIGLGWDALPLILRELEKEPDQWFWALKAISGEDPVPPENRGNMTEMRDAWLKWGRDKGLLNPRGRNVENFPELNGGDICSN